MVKFTRFLCAFLTLSLLLSACDDDENQTENNDDVVFKLNPVEADFVFDQAGGTHSVEVTLTGADEWDYDIFGESEWFDHSRDGNTINFEASANPDTENGRKATVIVTVTKPQSDKPVSVSFDLEQPARTLSDYERLLGKWELWSDKWVYSWLDPEDDFYPVKEFLLGTDATYLAFTFKEDEAGKTYKATIDYFEEHRRAQEEYGIAEDLDFELIFENITFVYNGDGTLDWIMNEPAVITDYGGGFTTDALLMVIDAQTFAGDYHSTENLRVAISDNYRTITLPAMKFELDGGEPTEGSTQIGLGMEYSFWGFDGYAEVAPWYFVTGDNARFVKAE